jgi:hypothetical protein
MSTGDTDTDDLRSGPEIHERLLGLLPLVGRWQGTGNGVAPATGEAFTYTQQLAFVHDGRPFLAYESRTWLVDAAGDVIRAAWRESGFWRPGATDDDVEAVIASNTGEAMTFAGVAGDLRWEIAARSIVATPTAKVVDGERRLYAVVGEQLVYVTELALEGQPFVPHLNARLDRV